jgi:LytS/YehU family sensor histidine kinase
MIWLTIAGFAMSVMFAPPWARAFSSYLRVGFFTALCWNLFWFGNAYLGSYVSRKFPWIERPVLTFVLNMIVTVVYTMSALYALVFFYDYVLNLNFRSGLTGTVWITLIITIVISMFMHSRSFLKNWRAAELNSAQLQKESMKAQFDSLKSQVNPHFLFNSLNALTNLIYEDQDKAALFVKQLSEVYRYVLDTQGKEIVPLSDEVKFLRSYMFLQQIRFGNKLNIEITLDAVNAQVAPLVLQMLVENAIKHNIVSSEQPLDIRIFSENADIVVENNLQKKNVLPEDSKGIGLENIKSRYKFLSNRNIEVINDGKSFIVKLPML